MKRFKANKDMGEGYSVEYRVFAETKEEATEKIRKLSGEYKIIVKEM